MDRIACALHDLLHYGSIDLDSESIAKDVMNRCKVPCEISQINVNRWMVCLKTSKI